MTTTFRRATYDAARMEDPLAVEVTVFETQCFRDEGNLEDINLESHGDMTGEAHAGKFLNMLTKLHPGVIADEIGIATFVDFMKLAAASVDECMDALQGVIPDELKDKLDLAQFNKHVGLITWS